MLSRHAHLYLLAATVCLTLGLPAPAATAEGAGKDSEQSKFVYSGISLYRSYCAVCHGTEAKGNGPMADQLRFHPPDLTLIAKRNRGKYPADKVYQIIDGREPLKGHGGPDMPVWGDAFRNVREDYSDEAVKAKIQAIVDYLAGLQEHTETK